MFFFVFFVVVVVVVFNCTIIVLYKFFSPYFSYTCTESILWYFIDLFTLS